MLEEGWEPASLPTEQAARRLGVPLVAYRKLEAGERWPNWETYDRIAAAFDGDLEVRSAHGRGTTVAGTLPVPGEASA